MGLVGKKKIVVDRDIYADVFVPGGAAAPDNADFTVDQQQSKYIFQHNSKYFEAPTKDKLRIALGKNWDYKEEGDVNKKIFSNKWGPLHVFYGNPIEMLPCEYSEQLIEDPEELETHLGVAYKDRVLLRGYGDKNGPEDKPEFNWIHYLKTGAYANDTAHSPLINTNTYFYDHYYESQAPFTPYELLSKQVHGGAFFADYKTYYNERLNSKNYEQTLNGLTEVHNSIPSIYGFLKILSNEHVIQNNNFNFIDLLTEIYEDATQNDDIYGVLQKRALEALISYYGFVDPKIYPPADPKNAFNDTFGKIITMNYDTTDADALFEDYVNRWSYVLMKKMKNQITMPEGADTALENILSNLAFSPNIFKIYDKLEKYKKHFPFYSEIEFTAEKSTLVGDLMKKLFMTRFMSYELAASTEDAYPDADIVTPAQLFDALGFSNAINDLQFYDFSGEDLYSDLSNAQPEISSGAVSAALTKRTINLPLLLQRWMAFDTYWPAFGEALSEQNPEGAPFLDVRKYTTFFSDDVNEAANIDSSCNTIFKKIFGASFQAKIADIYNQNKRSFHDIINGVPAYHEDIFYRIEKIRTLESPPAGAPASEVVQNIFIPNTSDLNIVKYVDTQLKYGNTANYKYNVYAERIVFGARYKYRWATAENVPHPDTYQNFFTAGGMSPGELLQAMEADNNNYIVDGMIIQYPGLEDKFDVTTAVRVDLQPSIKIIEDKIFSTPDIFIMDSPPPPPDVNIVPYRAINNQIKIMLDGVINRFRAKPVVILETDNAEFDRIKRAQLVVDGTGNPLEDGKIEFGSDDPVTGFQIFRTETKPTRYTDFELYHQLDSSVFEEFILPNRKYYYIFRAVDARGHFSNPTEAYEVELIDEKGAVKPIIRTIEIKPKELKTMVKECQKYIYLKPALKQLYFSDDLGSNGIFSDSTTKKRYKMRVTSKGSGKKIDINFSLKKKLTTN